MGTVAVGAGSDDAEGRGVGVRSALGLAPSAPARVAGAGVLGAAGADAGVLGVAVACADAPGAAVAWTDVPGAAVAWADAPGAAVAWTDALGAAVAWTDAPGAAVAWADALGAAVAWADALGAAVAWADALGPAWSTALAAPVGAPGAVETTDRTPSSWALRLPSTKPSTVGTRTQSVAITAYLIILPAGHRTAGAPPPVPIAAPCGSAADPAAGAAPADGRASLDGSRCASASRRRGFWSARRMFSSEAPWSATRRNVSSFGRYFLTSWLMRGDLDQNGREGALRAGRAGAARRRSGAGIP
ncbi:uncharacterized protein SOCEGT47_046590 [Sorangium cellulosum]|uniref:Uncharacterized protein n=1 Tax=Sorangium cellulosum TaxID=56 RepID=A0A4P2Q590_SORCE|nr:uncharacterized protein SOCEGT47_046590 [Sorangium cellulosum]